MRVRKYIESIIFSVYLKALLVTLFLSYSISLMEGLADDDLEYFLENGFLYWVFIYMPVIIFIFIVKRLKSGLALESYINNPNGEAVDAVLKQLRLRSKVLRGVSILALLMIALCILIGVYIFLSASTYSRTADLVRFDMQFENRVPYQRDKITLEQAKNKINVYGLERYLSLYADEAYKALNLNPEKPDRPNKSLEEKYKESLNAFMEAMSDESRQRNVEQEINEKYEMIIRKIKAAAEVKPKEIKSPDDSEEFYFLLSTTITKVDTILLILFLVRILLELYRYSAKLGAFYDARADSIQLSPVDTPEDLIMSLIFFSADSVEFKNSIEGPYDSLYKLAEISMRKFKNAGGGRGANVGGES